MWHWILAVGGKNLHSWRLGKCLFLLHSDKYLVKLSSEKYWKRKMYLVSLKNRKLVYVSIAIGSI